MDDHNHLGPYIKKVLTQQEEKGGFSIDDMPPGTKLSVETANSIYEITVIDGCRITIMGGVLATGGIRYPDRIEGLLNGCTFGTSLVKPKWIGEGMRMEIAHAGNQILTTSPIKNVIIETTDGRFVNLQWGQTN